MSKIILALSIIVPCIFSHSIAFAADYNPYQTDPEHIMHFKGNLKKFIAEYEENFGRMPKWMVANLESCVKDPSCYKGE